MRPRLLSRRAALAGLAALTACGANKPAADDGRTPVRITLNWFPEVEHGGLYAAQVHGYYAAAGLAVEIVPGRPDAPVLPQVAAGRSEFGVADASEVLLARAQQAPVVAVAAGMQTNPRCIMVHAESGAQRLDELRDLTLAMSAREPFAQFLQRRFTWPGVQVVPYTGSVAPFLVDPRAAQQAYAFSEPLIAARQGAKVRCLSVAELGFNPYASLLVTRESELSGRPELVKKVVAATIQGWEHYLRDPAATNAELRARNPELDEATLSAGAAAIAPLVREGDAPVGRMSADRWRTLHDQLVEAGVITAGATDPAQAFTASFLP